MKLLINICNSYTADNQQGHKNTNHIKYTLWILRSITVVIYNKQISYMFIDFQLTQWGRDKNDLHFADDIFKCIFMN